MSTFSRYLKKPCQRCKKPVGTHLRCKSCLILLHPENEKYKCHCGIQHTLMGKILTNYCADCETKKLNRLIAEPHRLLKFLHQELTSSSKRADTLALVDYFLNHQELTETTKTQITDVVSKFTNILKVNYNINE